MEWLRYEYRISTDPCLLQLDVIHEFLKQTTWAKDIPKSLVARALDGSLCFGLYKGEQQIGLARVITDRATLAYLSDLFVLEAYQGHGLGQWLLSCVISHPDLQSLRRMLLSTQDSHELFRKQGFAELTHPERMMEVFHADQFREEVNKLV